MAQLPDPALDALMAQVRARNTTLAQARARLAMVQAEARFTGASRLPSVGAEASAAHSGGPLINAAGQNGDLYTVRATASWELDLLGQGGARQQAARHAVTAEQASLADFTLLMEAAAARALFAARSFAAAARESAGLRTLLGERLAIAVRRQELGMITGDPVAVLHQRLAAAEQRGAALALARDRALRDIALLTGSDAPGVDPPLAGSAQPPPIPAGIPADLLARRPDVAAAEARLRAADARLQATRRSWLTPIALTASGGQASPSLGHLLAASASSFGLSALLALPLFDGGRHAALVARGRSERDLATAQYREQVLVALRDVADSLEVAQLATQQAATALTLETEATARLRSDRARWSGGSLSRADLLEREIAVAELTLDRLLNQGAQWQATVAVQQALGGGWRAGGPTLASSASGPAGS